MEEIERIKGAFRRGLGYLEGVWVVGRGFGWLGGGLGGWEGVWVVGRGFGWLGGSFG